MNQLKYFRAFSEVMFLFVLPDANDEEWKESSSSINHMILLSIYVEKGMVYRELPVQL